MSIASILTHLSTAKEALANKIVSLGGSISEGDGFEDFSSAMDTIPLGSSATLVSKTITENGTYDPSDDSADGYSSVTVSVSGSGDNGLAKGIIDRSIRSATLPSDLTSIGNYAFNACQFLTLTSLPSEITKIGFGAFSGCYSLALTSLPNGITTIEQDAFNGCSSLALTSIPNGVKTISQKSFKDCTSLTNLEIQYTGTASGTNKVAIQADAFNGCSNLAVISFPNVLQVPSLANISALSGLPANYEIRVPSNLLTSWKATTNWKHADVIDHIVAIAEE